MEPFLAPNEFPESIKYIPGMQVLRLAANIHPLSHLHSNGSDIHVCSHPPLFFLHGSSKMVNFTDEGEGSLQNLAYEISQFTKGFLPEAYEISDFSKGFLRISYDCFTPIG